MKNRHFDGKCVQMESNRVSFVRLALLGSAAGAANGLFGAGGGLILVPLLTRWIRLPEKAAFATSLAIMTPLSLASLSIYLLHGGVDVVSSWRYLLGGAIGGALAGPLFSRLPVVWLRRIMGLFLLYGGVRAVLLL